MTYFSYFESLWLWLEGKVCEMCSESKNWMISSIWNFHVYENDEYVVIGMLNFHLNLYRDCFCWACLQPSRSIQCCITWLVYCGNKMKTLLCNLALGIVVLTINNLVWRWPSNNPFECDLIQFDTTPWGADDMWCRLKVKCYRFLERRVWQPVCNFMNAVILFNIIPANILWEHCIVAITYKAVSFFYQIDMKKMPLGKISKKNITKAYKILTDCQKVWMSICLDQKETISLFRQIGVCLFYDK